MFFDKVLINLGKVFLVVVLPLIILAIGYGFYALFSIDTTMIAVFIVLLVLGIAYFSALNEQDREVIKKEIRK